MKKTFRRLQRITRVVMGKDCFFQKDIHCNYKRLGSDYGGWNIVVNRLEKGSIIYSVGVGEDVSFDIALINKFGLQVHAFDPTPKSISWIHTQHLSEKFIMHEYGMAGFDGSVSFNPPENPNHISHTILERSVKNAIPIKVPVKKLATIMFDLGHSTLDVLKMDIEGAEYSVIDDMESTNIRPTQLLIEFHHRFPGVGVEKTKKAINLIKNMGYKLFAVSESGEDFSFINYRD